MLNDKLSHIYSKRNSKKRGDVRTCTADSLCCTVETNKHCKAIILQKNSFKKKQVKSLSCVQLFATPWTVAYQAPPSMGFSRQKYWSGLPFPSPGDLPDPRIEPRSPTFQAGSLTSEPPGKSKKMTILDIFY